MLPEAARRPVWYLVNCVVLLLIFWRLHRRLQPGMRVAGGASEPVGRIGNPSYSRPVPVGLFWFLVVVLAGRHVLAPLENQSHDLIVFLTALLAIDASCAVRSRVGGVLAGFWAGRRRGSPATQAPSDPESALRTLMRAGALWEQLAREHADLTAFRSDLAAMHGLVGDLLNNDPKRHVESLAHLEKARRILDALSKQDPEQAEHRVEEERVEPEEVRIG